MACPPRETSTADVAIGVQINFDVPAVEEAKRDHDKRASTIETERAALEKRSQAEDARWEKQKEKLEIALRRARG
jgi:hypothetical protein